MPSPAKSMYLEHANMTVTDLDASIDFYAALFGFGVRWRGVNSDGKRSAHIGDDRFYLALFEKPGAAPATMDYDTAGLNHIGFVVEDLDAARARLTALGARPHHEADYEPGRRLYFTDPSGIEIELVEYETAPV